MKYQPLGVLLAMYTGLALSMYLTNKYSWVPFVGVTIAAGIYFSLKHLRLK
jgi:hypothetical protein